MAKITITTMCAVVNRKNEVLFIDRRKSWKGLALPGGHIEDNESVLECVQREIYEETGLRITNPIFKGITHFFNKDINERYLVFNFISYDFYGNLKESCSEGTLHWIPLNQFDKFSYAEGMELRFDVFFDEGITEMFVDWNKESGYIKVDKKKM